MLDNTFSAGHKIEEVKVITRKFQYLYDDENGFHFMNNDDFTQIYINKEMIENAQFMKAGEEVTIVLKEADEAPLSAEIPPTVTLEVIEADPGVKGNTATNALKMQSLRLVQEYWFLYLLNREKRSESILKTVATSKELNKMIH